LFLYNFKKFYNFMKVIFVIGRTLTLIGILRGDIDTISSLVGTLTIE
jgi:uncharacterized membrane protein